MNDFYVQSRLTELVLDCYNRQLDFIYEARRLGAKNLEDIILQTQLAEAAASHYWESLQDLSKNG